MPRRLTISPWPTSTSDATRMPPNGFASGLDAWPKDISLQKLELRVWVLKWKDKIVGILYSVLLLGRANRPQGLYHLNKFKSG